MQFSAASFIAGSMSHHQQLFHHRNGLAATEQWSLTSSLSSPNIILRALSSAPLLHIIPLKRVANFHSHTK
jgi:hypothetical protein